MQTNFKRVKEIFLAAVETSSPAEREACLRAECGADDVLRRQVEALLRRHEDAGSFLQSPVVAVAATAESQPQDADLPMSSAVNVLSEVTTESVGNFIGPYKLVQQLGEGGMGTVWLAEQSEPVKRRVALKLIKPGMDTRQIVARFEAERQALALMDHPNIASVLDAGQTATGRPYFVMDLVRGVPINEFCDQQELNVGRRLALFGDVCRAVQHAHQKGIIHRDIKPSNVLVTVDDGAPMVKVIDFGVAKALGQQLTEKTLLTGFAQLIGTPLYMSPEQAALSNVDVDTRSDIYSLGVLLYELLTGATPFDNERLKSVGYDEMRRIIREEEPPKPSTRITTMGEAASTLTSRRKSDPRRLSQTLRGELDWIVMKCLEKDRNRRYASANDLFNDLQRYLGGEPVLAGPPTARYRIRKFLGRHKSAIATTAAITIALLLVGPLVAWRESHLRGLAETRRQAAEKAEEQERAQRQAADERFEIAHQAVEEYLNRVTDDPDLKKSDFNTLRKKLLESAVPFYQRLAHQNPGDAAVEAERGFALQGLADLRQQTGESGAALTDYQQAVSVFTKLAADVPDVPQYRAELARSYNGVGAVMDDLGRADDADSAYRAALTIQQTLVAELPTQPECRLELAATQCNRGVLLIRLGKHQEAELALRAALATQGKLAADFPDRLTYSERLARYQMNLGNSLQELGQREKAEAAYGVAAAILRKLAAKEPKVPEYLGELAKCQNNQGKLLFDMGRPDEAVTAYRDALATTEKLATDFPTVPEYRETLALSHEGVGDLLNGLEDFTGAEEAYRAGLKIQQKLASDFPDAANYSFLVAMMQNDLANLLIQQRRRAEAEAALKEATTILDRLTADFPDVPNYRLELARIHFHRGQFLTDLREFVEAQSALRDSLAIQEKLTAEFPNVPIYEETLGDTYGNLGAVFEHSGDLGAAMEWFSKAIKALESVWNKDRRGESVKNSLAMAYLNRGLGFTILKRTRDAESDLERVIELAEGPLRRKASIARAGCLARRGEYAKGLLAADELMQDGELDANDCYDLACAYALSAAASNSDGADATESEKGKEHCITLALNLLRQSVVNGFNNVEHMMSDTDLHALRERDDFKQLIAQLESKQSK